MKKVFKYGTGQEIPAGAKYLCTQVETVDKCTRLCGEQKDEYTYVTKKSNALVWHYYEVEVKA